MSARPGVLQEAVPLNERPDETLHVSIVVAADSATGVPTTHLRERFTFSSAQEAAVFDAAVRVWLQMMPTPETVREGYLRPAPEPSPRRRRVSPGERLGEILDMGNLDEPEPVARPYDRETDGGP